MDMSTEIIAIDHGWSQIKTPTFIFTTGVTDYRNIEITSPMIYESKKVR